MATYKSGKRRRQDQPAQHQSKTQMREDLNNMIDDFLARGGKITICKDAKPSPGRRTPAPEDELGLFL